MHRNVVRCANMCRHLQSQMDTLKYLQTLHLPEQVHREVRYRAAGYTQHRDSAGAQVPILKRRQGFSNLLAGSDLEHCCGNHFVSLMSAYTV